jgi:hypothetical protein
MGFFARWFGRSQPALGQYVLRLLVRGPTGQTRSQHVKFEAKSLQTAIEHARRRAEHQHIFRWKLLDATGGRELAAGFGATGLRSDAASEVATGLN